MTTFVWIGAIGRFGATNRPWDRGDTTTNQPLGVVGQAYTGPVVGLQEPGHQHHQR